VPDARRIPTRFWLSESRPLRGGPCPRTGDHPTERRVGDSRQVGGSVGIALMGAIMAHEIGGRTTPQAFVHGLSTALVVAAAIALAGAVAAVLLVRSHAESRRPAAMTGAPSDSPAEPIPVRQAGSDEAAA
jgi:hypothetical protein